MNSIAAGFYKRQYVFPWIGVALVVFDVESCLQCLFVGDVEFAVHVCWRNMHHAAFFVQEIERIQIVAIAAPCLCDGVVAGMVDDHEIKMPALVDAGFIGGIEDEKIILWRQFLMLQDVDPRLLLL